MAILRQWRYSLPLLLFLAVAMDIGFSSFVLNKAAIHFHPAWLYLLVIFVPLFVAVYYYNTLDEKQDYTIRHWFKIVTSVLILAFMCSYFVFHMAIWGASYTPMLPTVSHELTIVERQPFGRTGRRIVVGADADNNRVKLRLYGLYYLEGDVVELDCVQIGTVCRITDSEIRK